RRVVFRSPTGWTPDSWAAVEQALAWARSTTAPSTQNQADAPARALALAVASLEPAPTQGVAFAAEASLRALAGKDYVAVRVVNEEDVPVDVVVSTPYGSRTFAGLEPGANAYQAFASRL